jgi:3'-5' exoribonuclease
MAAKLIPLITLAEANDGQEADWFLLLSRKEELKTREGKPYWRVTFRDAHRELNMPLWQDSPWADVCRDEWQVGNFYKIRGIFRDSQFGPQIEIRKWRVTHEDDKAEGFDPLMLLPRSQYDVTTMFTELVALAQQHIVDASLAALVMDILTRYRELICDLPAAVHHHHAFRGGFLEHILSVTRNAVFLADKYSLAYPVELPPTSRDLVIAGALLHDIGKLWELRTTSTGAEYSPVGELIGHALLGRDLIRETTSRCCAQ